MYEFGLDDGDEFGGFGVSVGGVLWEWLAFLLGCQVGGEEFGEGFREVAFEEL